MMYKLQFISLILLYLALSVLGDRYDMFVQYYDKAGTVGDQYGLDDTNCKSFPGKFLLRCHIKRGRTSKTFKKEYLYLVGYKQPGCNPGTCAGYQKLSLQEVSDAGRDFNMTIPSLDQDRHFVYGDGPYPKSAQWVDGDTVQKIGCPNPHY